MLEVKNKEQIVITEKKSEVENLIKASNQDIRDLVRRNKKQGLLKREKKRRKKSKTSC